MESRLEQMSKYAALIRGSRAYRMLGGGGGSYLLRSPDNDALEVLARLFISKCAGISEQKALGFNADIVELPLLKDVILTGDIEFLVQNVLITPFELPYRFFILRQAHLMNETAQNKLLKTLEEPPASACILLLSSGEGLLPTVVSRCNTVALESFSQDDIRNELEKYYPPSPKLQLAAASCRGLIGLADRIVGDSSYTKNFEAALSILTEMKTSKDAVIYAAMLESDTKSLTGVLDFLELLIRDIMTAKLKNAELMNFSHIHHLRELTDIYPPACFEPIMQCIYRAQNRLKNNGNAVSVIDELLFSMLEERAKASR